MRRGLRGRFPLFVANEELFGERGVLGVVWEHVPTPGPRISLLQLPAKETPLYDPSRCLGRRWREEGSGPRIFTLPPRIPPGRPPEAA